MAYVQDEAGLQDAVVEALRYAGFTVLQVGRWRRRTRCPECGAWHTPRGGYGNETGTPDLLIGHRHWGAVLLPIELKAPGAVTLLGTVRPGALQPAQRALHELGITEVCFSLEGVWGAIERMDARIIGQVPDGTS